MLQLASGTENKCFTLEIKERENLSFGFPVCVFFAVFQRVFCSIDTGNFSVYYTRMPQKNPFVVLVRINSVLAPCRKKISKSNGFS